MNGKQKILHRTHHSRFYKDDGDNYIWQKKKKKNKQREEEEEKWDLSLKIRMIHMWKIRRKFLWIEIKKFYKVLIIEDFIKMAEIMIYDKRRRRKIDRERRKRRKMWFAIKNKNDSFVKDQKKFKNFIEWKSKNCTENSLLKIL